MSSNTAISTNNFSSFMTCSKLEELIEKTNNFAEKSTFKDEFMTDDVRGEAYSPGFNVDPDYEW